MYVAGIPSHLASEAPETVWAYVGKALRRGRSLNTTEAIRSACSAGEMQLWVVRDDERVWGAAVTEIRVYPTCKSCLIVAVGADTPGVDVFTPSLAVLEAWAAEQGCDYVELIGRPGWARRLPEFKPVAIHSRKEIRHGRRQQSRRLDDSED